MFPRARLARSGVIGDVHAEAADAVGPLGLLLFVEEGAATMLEAFAYADCRYVRWEPHANGKGATSVNVAERDPDSMWIA